MIFGWIGDSGEAEIANFQVAVGVEQQITRFQISMQTEKKTKTLFVFRRSEKRFLHVGRMNVFQSAKNLIEEITNVFIGEPLMTKQLIQIAFHQTLNDVNIFH